MWTSRSQSQQTVLTGILTRIHIFKHLLIYVCPLETFLLCILLWWLILGEDLRLENEANEANVSNNNNYVELHVPFKTEN